MLIMIIFLILTVILIAGTYIYLYYKKKNIDNQNFNLPIIEKTTKKSKKQLKDILSIKIKDNIICLGNRFSSIIRLGNIDYNMLSEGEQNSIENILIQCALAIDYPIQFFYTTEYIDTNKIVSKIQQKPATNNYIQEYKNYLMQYLENLMENRTISVIKSYAIISYDGSYENAKKELDRRCLSLKSNLLKAKIVCEILDEDELYNLIYRELNKNEALSISNLKEGVKNLYVGKKQETKKH